MSDKNSTDRMSFLDLAEAVLESEKRPMTTDEIWALAVDRGLVERLRTSGKTPKHTLGAQLYTQANTAEGLVVKVGARPAQFVLRGMMSTVPANGMSESCLVSAPPTAPPTKYSERQLHPLLVWFAYFQFNAHCKTIMHEKSVKKGQKHNQWLHPDIVGFSLPTRNWGARVVSLAQTSGNVAAKLYSFELKIQLDFSTLREYFFQAVSNSSWAHEGYLVAVEISEDQEFLEELRRLSQSFGIGVVRIDVSEPQNSEVLLPARQREEIDWETVNRIATVNEDFTSFLDSASNSVKINQAATNGFDRVLSDDEAAELGKKLLRGPQNA